MVKSYFFGTNHFQNRKLEMLSGKYVVINSRKGTLPCKGRINQTKRSLQKEKYDEIYFID